MVHRYLSDKVHSNFFLHRPSFSIVHKVILEYSLKSFSTYLITGSTTTSIIIISKGSKQYYYYSEKGQGKD